MDTTGVMNFSKKVKNEFHQMTGRLEKKNGFQVKKKNNFCSAKILQILLLFVILLFILTALVRFWSFRRSDRFSVVSEINSVLTQIQISMRNYSIVNQHSLCPSNQWTHVGPPGYESSCYKVAHSKMSWSDARKYCQNLGGDLISVETKNEEAYIQNLLKTSDYAKTFWTGGTNANEAQSWVWIATGQLVQNAWHEVEAEKLKGNTDCAFITKRYKQFLDAGDCHDLHAPICEVMIEKREFERHYETRCPHETASSCYIIVKDKLSWDGAEKVCLKKGGYLATVDSVTEENFFITVTEGYKIGLDGMYYKEHKHYLKFDEARKVCEREGAVIAMPSTETTQEFLGNFRQIWLGIVDEDGDGNFTFIDGSKIEKYYWSKYNRDEKYPCVVKAYQSQWISYRCDFWNKFVCQRKEKIPILPVAFKNGQAGATSTAYHFSANNAFQPAAIRGWRNNYRHSFPQTIWYKFKKAKRIVRFGFLGGKYNQNTSPQKIEFVASNDCGDWKVLAKETMKFTRNGEEKVFNVEDKNIGYFFCYGIRVLKTKRSRYVDLENIKMWDSFSDGPRITEKSSKNRAASKWFEKNADNFYPVPQKWFVGGRRYMGDWRWFSNQRKISKRYFGNILGNETEVAVVEDETNDKCLVFALEIGASRPNHWLAEPCYLLFPSICEIPNPALKGYFSQAEQISDDFNTFSPPSSLHAHLFCATPTRCFAPVRLETTWRSAITACSSAKPVSGRLASLENVEDVWFLEKKMAKETNLAGMSFWVAGRKAAWSPQWAWPINATTETTIDVAAFDIIDKDVDSISEKCLFAEVGVVDWERDEDNNGDVSWKAAPCSGWRGYICEFSSDVTEQLKELWT